MWEFDPFGLVSSVPVEPLGQALALSVDGARVAAYSFDPPGLHVWSLPTLRPIGSCNLQELGVWDGSCALVFTPDARGVIAAGWDGVLRRVQLSTLPGAVPRADR